MQHVSSNKQSITNCGFDIGGSMKLFQRSFLALTLASISAIASFSTFAQDKIVTVGDSTVSSYSGGSSEKHGWGQYLNQFVKSGSAKVINYAKGGRTAEMFWKEGHWSRAQKENPKIVFIQFGHNDSNPDKGTNLSEFKSYLRDYAADCKDMKATLIFVTPPRRLRFSNGKPSTELSSWAAAIKEVAKEVGAPVVDLYTLWGNIMAKEGNGLKSHYATGDTTHFNTKGATRVAGIVASEAKRLSPAFAKVAK